MNRNVTSSSEFTFCTCVKCLCCRFCPLSVNSFPVWASLFCISQYWMSCFLLHGSTKVAVFFCQLCHNVRRRLPNFLRMPILIHESARRLFLFFPICYPIHFSSKFSDGRGECASYAIPWCVVKFVTEWLKASLDQRKRCSRISTDVLPFPQHLAVHL